MTIKLFFALALCLMSAAAACAASGHGDDTALPRLSQVEVSAGLRLTTLRQLASAIRRFEKIDSSQRSLVRLAWRLRCADDAECQQLDVWAESDAQRVQLQREGIHVLLPATDAIDYKSGALYANRRAEELAFVPDVQLVLPIDGPLTTGYLREGFRQVWGATKKVNRLWVAGLIAPDAIRFYFAEPQSISVRGADGETLWRAQAGERVSLCVERLNAFPASAVVLWDEPPVRIGGEVAAGLGVDCNDSAKPDR